MCTYKTFYDQTERIRAKDNTRAVLRRKMLMLQRVNGHHPVAHATTQKPRGQSFALLVGLVLKSPPGVGLISFQSFYYFCGVIFPLLLSKSA